AISPGDREDLEPLLFFRTTRSDEPISLAEYVQRMARNQKDIYYILGEDITSAARSPHLDAFRQRGIEVLYLTDPVDPIMLMGLREFEGQKLRSVDEADIDLRELGETPQETARQQREALPADACNALRPRLAQVVVDGVQEVR